VKTEQRMGGEESNFSLPHKGEGKMEHVRMKNAFPTSWFKGQIGRGGGKLRLGLAVGFPRFTGA